MCSLLLAPWKGQAVSFASHLTRNMSSCGSGGSGGGRGRCKKPRAKGCVRMRSSSDPCMDLARYVKSLKKPVYVSAWKGEMSTLDPTKDTIRYDLMHYDEDASRERKIQRTWIECPPLKKRCKQKVTDDTIVPPVYEKRERRCPVESKPGGCPDVDCLKIKLPCCRIARNPPCCIVFPKIRPCVKIQTPFPSFSECHRDKMLVAPPNECNAFRRPMQCEINPLINDYVQNLRKRQIE